MHFIYKYCPLSSPQISQDILAKREEVSKLALTAPTLRLLRGTEGLGVWLSQR